MTTGRLFVLTGAPGVGKSAVLAELGSGIVVVPEPARQILAEERAGDGESLPERDRAGFVARLLDRSVEKHEAAARRDRVTVFDRGVPDCIAYAIAMDVDAQPSIDAAREHRYHGEVLVLEPWREIYATDEERRMSFEDTIAFHEAILEAYRIARYTLRPIARDSIAARAAFVKTFVLDGAR